MTSVIVMTESQCTQSTDKRHAKQRVVATELAVPLSIVERSLCGYQSVQVSLIEHLACIYMHNFLCHDIKGYPYKGCQIHVRYSNCMQPPK